MRSASVLFALAVVAAATSAEAAKIYAKIPEYRVIADKRLTRDDPEYWPLMRRASAVFVRSLKRVCGKDGYDLIGETGAIKPKAPTAEKVPSITRDVIRAVQLEKIVRGAVEDDEADAAALEELVNFPELP